MIIIVTIIVILIAALVILTIFSQGIQPAVDYTSQSQLCVQSCSISCQLSGNPPDDWSIEKNVIINGEKCKKSCKDLVDCVCGREITLRPASCH